MEKTEEAAGPISSQVFRQRLLEAIAARNFDELRDLVESQPHSRVAAVLENLPDEAEAIAFRALPKGTAALVFEYIDLHHQHRLLHALGRKEVAGILEEMSADDRTAVLAELPANVQKQLLEQLEPDEREIARTLLGYPKGSVGRLMTPDYISLDERMTVSEAIAYIRTHGQDSDTINVVYAVKGNGELAGSLRIRSLIMGDPEQLIVPLILQDHLQLFAGDPIENAVSTFRDTDLYALPVVSSSSKMLGIVTFDDVLKASERLATEAVQKIGGSSELGVPYLATTISGMLWKRGPWLIVLFLGGMFTANAMVHYETQIEKAVVLSIFLPLIIASGGNAGSQSSTLVIRALGLGELGLKDWWIVLGRELTTGLALGGILGLCGLLRVEAGTLLGEDLTVHWFAIGLTIGCALFGVVVWGSLVGAMLPLILRKCGLDPATSSAPFVSTFVDVTGIIIYFSVATVLLRGTLL
ncbi:MAG: magnesium transporter [Verrucomicrobia bacterium]|nr:magnesium transporter [Verrucomicrobiota bacterium]